MIQRRLLICTLSAAGLAFSGSAHAFIGGIAVAMGRASEAGEVSVSFTADAEVETQDNKFTSRVYYRPGMVRDDMNMGGQQVTTIQRYDRNTVWMLMSQGMYMEFGIGESAQAPEYKLVERSVEGQELVDGVETTKYKTIYEGPDGRFGGFTWVTDDNIAVKGFMVSETRGEKERIIFTLKNLERADQPESLFELPVGAKRLDLPNLSGAGGFGNLLGQSGASTLGAPPPGTATTESPSQDEGASPEEGGFLRDLAGEAADVAEKTAEQETKGAVRKKVRKGLRGLFNR